MGGPRPADEQKLWLYELKREGHSNRRVAEILGEESPNGVAPDQSTIYRLAKKLTRVEEMLAAIGRRARAAPD